MTYLLWLLSQFYCIPNTDHNSETIELLIMLMFNDNVSADDLRKVVKEIIV